jgi:hypothetical protein
VYLAWRWFLGLDLRLTMLSPFAAILQLSNVRRNPSRLVFAE